MNYEFNDQYVAKLLMSLVNDEGARILSLGLAKRDDLKNFVEPVLHSTIKQAANKGTKTLLDNLSALYHDLASVKLPGDFEKMAMDPEDKLVMIVDILPDVPYDGEKFYDLSSILDKSKSRGGLGLGSGDGKEDGSGPNPLCPKKDDEDEEKKDDKEEKEQDADMGELEDTAEIPPNVMLSNFVIDQLEKIAYDLGKKGNHEAAYIVERKIRELESKIK